MAARAVAAVTVMGAPAVRTAMMRARTKAAATAAVGVTVTAIRAVVTVMATPEARGA